MGGALRGAELIGRKTECGALRGVVAQMTFLAPRRQVLVPAVHPLVVAVGDGQHDSPPEPPRRGWGRRGVLLLGVLALPCLLVGGGGVLLYLKWASGLEQSMNTAFRTEATQYAPGLTMPGVPPLVVRQVPPTFDSQSWAHTPVII